MLCIIINTSDTRSMEWGCPLLVIWIYERAVLTMVFTYNTNVNAYMDTGRILLRSVPAIERCKLSYVLFVEGYSET